MLCLPAAAGSYALDGAMPGLPLKSDRTDAEHGGLQGHISRYTMAGNPTKDRRLFQ